MSTTLDKLGRMVIPVEVRTKLALLPGEELLVIPDGDGEFRVISRRAARRRAQKMVMDLVEHTGGGSLADELIADRRREEAAEPA